VEARGRRIRAREAKDYSPIAIAEFVIDYALGNGIRKVVDGAAAIFRLARDWRQILMNIWHSTYRPAS